MTLPRTAGQVLSGHVRLEVRCIDRVLLTFRQPRLQPRLQYGQGVKMSVHPPFGAQVILNCYEYVACRAALTDVERCAIL
jgi:hypothetical protein